jgi:prophage regulatory protein
MPPISPASSSAHDSYASFDELPDVAVLRLPTVMQLAGLSRATIWRRCREGRFPKPLQLGATRAIGWRAGDLRQWLSALGDRAG